MSVVRIVRVAIYLCGKVWHSNIKLCVALDYQMQFLPYDVRLNRIVN